MEAFHFLAYLCPFCAALAVLVPLLVVFLNSRSERSPQSGASQRERRQWALTAQECGLIPTDDGDLYGERGGVELSASYQGEFFLVEARHGVPCSSDFSAQAGPGREHTRNPLLDSQIRFTGSAPLRWDDERLMVALLAVLHAHPGSKLNHRRICLRGAAGEPLEPCLDAVVELVTAMRAAQRA